MTKEVVIVSAVRTPIGRYGGSLARVRPDDLAAHVVASSLARVPRALESVQEVVFGATNQSGEDNRNVARMSAMIAGLPYEVTGVTVNRLCGSGLEALIYASRAIRLGEADVMVAGGVESMSRAPFVMAKTEEAFSRTPPPMFDTSLGWRFPNPRMQERFPLEAMGETAENVAEKYRISRENQDQFALRSHQNAACAWESGAFASEIVPVEVSAQKKGAATLFDRDESVRTDTTLERLSSLKPVFRANGTVTAGNSSPLNDGASALVVTSLEWARANNVAPLARVVASASAGVNPRFMGIGPVPATQKVLACTGMNIDQLDLIEINEAFAAQALACVQELGMDIAKVNIRGGGIALGHPIGSSGARIVVTLAHALRERGARFGLATLCIGVGQGLAMIIENMAGR